MKKLSKRWLATLAMLLCCCMTLAACGGAGTSDPEAGASALPSGNGDGNRIRLGLVVGDFSNPFFSTLAAGAEAAAADAGVEITVLGSKTLEENVKVVEDIIQTGVDALCFTPFDAKGNIPVVEKANKAGIPVFTADSYVDGGEVVAYIGTDNKLGGVLAGEWLADRINGKGVIAIIEGGAGSSTNVDRCEGFRSVIDKYPDIEVVASVPANWARDQGLKAMSDIIAGHPDLTAVMAMNDEMAIGAMEALKAAGASDSVILCGYNGADEAIKYVHEGTMSATVVQFPEEMGKLFVENAVALVRDGTPPASNHLKPPVAVLDTQAANKAYKAVTGTASEATMTSAVKASAPHKLGLVVGDFSNPFFSTLAAGAEAAAADAGVEITVLGSKTLEENVKVVEDIIQTGVDALCFTPFDAKGNIPVVEKANKAGIPVFTADSYVDGGEVVSYIGTDNKLGGVLAGEWLADRINGKGKIAIIEGGAGSSTNVDRCEGFRSVIDKYPGIEVVASVPANWARDQGLKAMSDIIAGHPDLTAVMAMNDEMAIGAMEALKAAGASDSVILCGYNGADEAIKYVHEGTMSATVVQFPEEMGKLYIENAIRVIEGLDTPPAHLKPQVMAMDTVFIKKIVNAIEKG